MSLFSDRPARSEELEEAIEDTEDAGDADGALRLSQVDRRQRGPPRQIPDRWTQIHTLDRLEDAYRVLATQPGAKGRQSSTVWPATAAEPLSLLETVQMTESGELAAVEEERNRVRLQPTSADITRMEQALAWPSQYLSDWPYLARAIQLRALWAAMDVDIRKRCARRRIDHDGFNRDWQRALALITGALIAAGLPVS